MPAERVQKILAKAGIASRRKAEELITEGSVTINGKVAKLGDKAEMGSDAIKVNGKLLHTLEEPVYLAFNKPKGVISMMGDPENRPSLKDYLRKVNARVFPIGRLDFNSEGLILLTNNGDFAEKLQRRDDIPRAYSVKVKGHPDRNMLASLEKGAKLGNRMVRPYSVRVAEDLENKARIEVVLMSSGAIDLKSFFEMKGFLVDRITRTSYGHITLHGILPGAYRLLKASQVEALLNQPELGVRVVEKAAAKTEGRIRKWDVPEAEREAALQEKREKYGDERHGPRKPAITPRDSSAPRPRGGAGAGPRPRSAEGARARFGAESRPRASASSPRSTSGPRPVGEGSAKPRFDSDSRPPRTGARPRSAYGAADKPRFGAGDKPRFGAGDKPRFGAGDKPRFGAGDKPRFGAGDKPRFGAGDKPRFGAGDKPRFGAGDKPRFGAGDKPRFGAGDKPRFGAGARPRSGTGPRPVGEGSSSGFNRDRSPSSRPSAGRPPARRRPPRDQ